MPKESCVFEVCCSTSFVYTSVNALATILSTRPLARMSWRMGHSLHTRPQHTTRHIHGIKTMQDLLFSAFLYTAAFCFICWFRYNPNPSGALVVAKSDKWEAISSDETEEVDTSMLLPLESAERPTLIVKEAQREVYALEPKRESDDLVSDLWVLTQSESKSSTDTKPDNQIADTDTPKPQPIDSINSCFFVFFDKPYRGVEIGDVTDTIFLPLPHISLILISSKSVKFWKSNLIIY